MQFFKILTVMKYRSDTKNKSNTESSSEYCSFEIFDALLKVMSTVKRVRIKPAKVNPTFDKSDVIDKDRSIDGNLSLSR